MRIRSYFLLLAAVVLVPGFLAAVVAVDQLRQAERETALRGLRETVRATALLVDGEVQRSLGALTALANSPSLAAGDLAAFYAEARATDQRPDVWTLLLDDSGTQRVNTALPFGTPPPPGAEARVATALATGRLLVTDVFVGPATGKLLTTLYLAAPSPAGRFVVAKAFSVEHWKKTALRPQGQADWIVAVIDRQGKFIARSHLTDELLGKPARPELVAAAAASNEGLIRHSTLEGVDAYDAYTHSALTGWTIAVAAPVRTIEASAFMSVAWLAAGVAVALALAMLGASILNRTLIHAIDDASSAALTLGEGRMPAPMRTGLYELGVLGNTLAVAGRLLAAEQDARALVEAQRERLLEGERLAREAAQRENTAKDQFIALLGHELRSPLAAIAGAAEVLSRSATTDPASRHLLGIVLRQNRHLKRIVDDLLEMSRMLSGKIVPDARPLDLAACVRDCIEALRASSGGTEGHRLVVDAEEAWVRADPVRIEQIVNNLVTNALKFSKPGAEVRIRVSGNGEHARLKVADDGSGIPPALLPRVFEPFVQGPAPASGASSGLGIGLALVKQLAELHGGTVRASSAGLGQGTSFVVELPQIEPPSAGAALPAATPQTERRRCRVLLVEDNVDARETMAELLRLMGYDVVEAADGPAALDAARACVPDVAVMDLGLPGMSGLQLAAEMKSTPALRQVGLIALSGYGQPRDIEASRAAGFDQHLIKPAEPDLLMQAIETQCTASVLNGAAS